MFVGYYCANLTITNAIMIINIIIIIKLIDPFIDYYLLTVKIHNYNHNKNDNN